ncbi:hypothetical protein AB0C33_22165 [Nonomuraea sp. NPDC048881]|uniref:hypothetical protein n=1 Tax=Nonomuraea sp. NPDC048881 TaxID=3155030 RepID=UPI0033E344BF
MPGQHGVRLAAHDAFERRPVRRLGGRRELRQQHPERVHELLIHLTHDRHLDIHAPDATGDGAQAPRTACRSWRMTPWMSRS